MSTDTSTPRRSPRSRGTGTASSKAVKPSNSSGRRVRPSSHSRTARRQRKKKLSLLGIGLRLVIMILGIFLVVFFLTDLMGEKSQVRYITHKLAEEVESRSIPGYEYDNRRFATEPDGTVTYSDENYTGLQGVDISSHNGEIDWAAVASDGIDYAIVRVGWRGYSEGNVNADSTAAFNMDGALASGLQVGAYFYSQAITPEEAVEEAKKALEVIDGRNLSLPVYFDWELPANDEARTSNPDGETLTQCAIAFCETIKAAGYQAGVYFYPSLGLDTYNLAELLDYHLWLSQPGDTPDFQYAIETWQYSCSGTVEGISTITDRNLWFVKNPSGTDSAAEPAGDSSSVSPTPIS